MTPEDAERLRRARRRATRLERERGWSRNYPDHPCVDTEFSLRLRAARAMARFARRRPFRLEGDAFLDAAQRLVRGLARAYNIPTPDLQHIGPWEGSSDESGYNRAHHCITLSGQPSVLTLLHEFAHACGWGETGAAWWSVNTFRLAFPRSFAALRGAQGTHALRRGEPREPEVAAAAWQTYYAERAMRLATAEVADRPQAPDGATQWECSAWPRMGHEARQTVALRAAVRISRALGDGATRFAGLDAECDTPLALPTPGDGATRFAGLELDS
jgi:hypothetical protein